MAFVGRFWAAISGSCKPREFQTIAISRIDFVDWTFPPAPARVTLSVLFLVALVANCDVRPGTQ
jgi:hypothetical protein